MVHAPTFLTQFLDRLESLGEILPGSRERIFKHIPPSTDPGKLFQSAIDLIVGNKEEGRGSVFLTIAGKKALRQSEPLQFILSRMPLKEGSSNELFLEWAAYLCDKPIADQARIAVDRLSRTHEKHLIDNPQERHEAHMELRAYAAVERFSYALDPARTSVEDLARRWASDLGALPHHEAVKRVYGRLREPFFCEQFCHRGNPISFIPGADEMFQPLPRVEDRAIADKVLARRAEIEADTLAQIETMGKELERVEAENRASAARIKEYEASR